MLHDTSPRKPAQKRSLYRLGLTGKEDLNKNIRHAEKQPYEIDAGREDRKRNQMSIVMGPLLHMVPFVACWDFGKLIICTPTLTERVCHSKSFFGTLPPTEHDKFQYTVLLRL